jgi:hypothetical protein
MLREEIRMQIRRKELDPVRLSKPADRDATSERRLLKLKAKGTECCIVEATCTSVEMHGGSIRKWLFHLLCLFFRH